MNNIFFQNLDKKVVILCETIDLVPRLSWRTLYCFVSCRAVTQMRQVSYCLCFVDERGNKSPFALSILRSFLPKACWPLVLSEHGMH